MSVDRYELRWDNGVAGLPLGLPVGTAGRRIRDA